jgi:hypothetical protein
MSHRQANRTLQPFPHFVPCTTISKLGTYGSVLKRPKDMKCCGNVPNHPPMLSSSSSSSATSNYKLLLSRVVRYARCEFFRAGGLDRRLRRRKIAHRNGNLIAKTLDDWSFELSLVPLRRPVHFRTWLKVIICRVDGAPTSVLVGNLPSNMIYPWQRGNFSDEWSFEYLINGIL